MRISGFAVGLIWCGAAWMSGGCQTASGPDLPVPEPGGKTLSISREGQARAEALAFYGTGLHYESLDQFDAALSNFQEAVRREPDNEELVYSLATSFLQQKRNQEAIEVTEAFVRQQPQSRKMWLLLAFMHRVTGQQEQVEETYAQMIRRFPQDPAGYVELATLYVSQGKEEEAIDLLEKAARQVEDPTDLLRALGSIYLQRSVTQGKAEDEKENRQAAIQIFERLVRENPDEVGALYQLGDLYILDQQIEKAIECYEKIEAQHPNNLQVKQKLALSFVASGNKEKAISQLEQIASKRPDNPRIFYYLGELYEEVGHKEKAELNYEFATKAGQNDPAPYLKLALLKLEERPQEALETLQEGLALMPDQPRLTEMLAYVYLSQKKYDLAEETFARALSLFNLKEKTPVSSSLYFNYAVAAQKAGHVGETEKLLLKSMDINPAILEAYVQYMLRQDDRQEQDIAIGLVEKMSAQNPRNATLLVHLGTLHSGLKQYARAVEAFEKAEPLLDEAGEQSADWLSFYYFWYGAACEREGLFDQAITNFEKSIELDAENPEAYNYLAYMWAEKGIQLDRAMEYIQKALAHEPNSGAFLDTLGWIYFMKGDYDQALVHIQKALEVIPDDATILDHLGDVQAKLNHPAEAVAAWKKAFVHDPENQKLADKLTAQGVDLEPLRQEAAQQQNVRKESAEKELLEPTVNDLPIPLQEDEDLPILDTPDFEQP